MGYLDFYQSCKVNFFFTMQLQTVLQFIQLKLYTYVSHAMMLCDVSALVSVGIDFVFLHFLIKNHVPVINCLKI